MVEAEHPPAAAAPAPSRYRSIRRKLPPPAESALPPMPSPSPRKTAAAAGATSRKLQATTTPDDDVARHPSRLRALLKLNTKAAAAAEPEPGSYTAPPLSMPHHHKLTKLGHHKSAAKAAEGGPAAEEKERTDVASGKDRSKRKEKKPADPPAYDIKVQIHFSKGEKSMVGITDKTSAGAVLEQVRPGHERVLLECWPGLGLQRQVRYFEHVSDVVNTWDAGTSPHLKVSKTIWGETKQKLEDFPRHEPMSGEALFYYYVTADKKWQKRTLKVENGSLRIMKKDRPQDKDHLQSITLEYFDIYTFQDAFSPFKGLKCPTKYCFALKSQHKQSLFGKNSVFVHYFAVDNEEYFIRWFSLIRDAKSRLIAEKKSLAWWTAESEDEPELPPEKPDNPSRKLNTATSPRDAAPRNRNFPQPLISQKELEQPPSSSPDVQRSKSLNRARSTKKGSARDRSVSVSVPKVPEVFSAGGLLGADYEEKRRQAQLHYAQEKQNKDPFQYKSSPASASANRNISPRTPQALVSLSKETPSSAHSKSNTSEPRSLTHRDTTTARPSTGSHGKSTTTPTTLLDFSNEEIIPAIPQHRNTVRRGHGFSLADQQGKGGGLIGFATNVRSPDRDDAVIVANGPVPRHGVTHTEEAAFTGTGLLAREFQSAGAGRTGHGVATAKDAIGRNGEIRPLMANEMRSVFAPGSLLEKREMAMGGPGQKPIIDRDGGDSDDE